MGSPDVSVRGRAAITSPFTIFVILISIMVRASHEQERLRWCGKRLNPRDFARAMRAATDLMLACKNQIMLVNISPLVIKEHRRLCIIVRMCYAFTTYSDSALMEEMRLNVTSVLSAMNSCALKKLPREEKYTLAILAYFADFISG
ncbi:uncharacterized protein LOC142591172 isoform X2 [Dermacentor variabilis]|uniref:uncharacterized protein LOC142591172 isoform X2 n=1 Tax=Dermacentor variabilis TaxID=34621 RepID=UPI003F5CAF4F